VSTLTACKREAKRKIMNSGMLIAHRDGFVDRRGIDRGYTLMSMREAMIFQGQFPNVTFKDVRGKLWSPLPWTMAEVVAARLRTGEPVE
jgi:hypothetical protein